MWLLFLGLISAEVVLIDDLNLARTNMGTQSLAQMSGRLRTQLGQDVRVLTPTMNSFPKPAVPQGRRVMPPRRIQLKAPRGAFPAKMPPGPRRFLPPRRMGVPKVPSRRLPMAFPDDSSVDIQIPELNGYKRPSPLSGTHPATSPSSAIPSTTSGPASSSPSSTLNGHTTQLGPKSPFNTTTPRSRSSIDDDDPQGPAAPASTASLNAALDNTRTLTPVAPIIHPVTDDTDDGPDTDQVLRNISKIALPHLRGKQSLKKHNQHVLSAYKHKRAYLDNKLQESKQIQQNVETKLNELRRLHKRLTKRMEAAEAERDNVQEAIEMKRQGLEGNHAVVENIHHEMNKNCGELRLTMAEIGRLERQLKQERSKSEILREQHKIFHKRLETVTEADGGTDLNPYHNKLSAYDILLERLKTQEKELMGRINTLRKRKNDEINRQNQLAIGDHGLDEGHDFPLVSVLD